MIMQMKVFGFVFYLLSAKMAIAQTDSIYNPGLKELYGDIMPGLTFCYHNHGYEFSPYNNETLFDYILANTNPEYVSFEMDVLWTFHGGGDAVQLLKKYGNRFKLMHLKDLRKGVKGDLSGKTPVENDVALGTGQINLRSIIEAAKKSSVEYYYIEDESNHVNVQVPQSIKFLKKL